MMPLNAQILEYLPIPLFFSIALAMGVAFIAVSLAVSPNNPYPEKVSAYECGFNPLGDSRMKFDVRFYLVAILFIIFDLDVAFLFPWIFEVAAGNVAAFWSMMLFLAVMVVGFVYEWRQGALEWD